jgi:PAS domain S-box-containing protein
MDGQPPAALDFHRIFACAPTPLMVVDRELTIVYANEAYLRTTMRRLSDIQGRYLFDAFPESPKRLALFRGAFEKAVSGEKNVLTTEPFAVPAPGPEGSVKQIIWTCTQTPIHDDAGNVAYVLQHAVDVTAEQELNRHNETLFNELNHRVKNLLATIQAIARQSLVDAKGMRQARDDFLARIQAMATVQDLVLADDRAGTDLRVVMGQALRPFGYEEGQQAIVLDGPSVPVTARQAQTFSMGIHELATNAAKYGALSTRSGAVRLEWSHEPESGEFRLSWIESNGPAVSPPERQGFGSAVLTRILAQEISGRVSMDYPPDGAVCRMQGRLPRQAD